MVQYVGNKSRAKQYVNLKKPLIESFKMAENVLESKEISEFQDVLDNNLVNTEKT